MSSARARAHVGLRVVAGWGSDAGSRARGEARIGEILLGAGSVDAGRLAAALDAQAGSGARIGELLVARGWADGRAVAEAAAVRDGLGFVDLDAEPPTPDLADPADAAAFLAHRAAPWRRIAGQTVYALADGADGPALLGALANPPPFALFVLAEPAALRRAQLRALGPELAARASTLRPAAESARAGVTRSQRRLGLGAVAFAAAGLIAAPALAATALFAALILVNLVSALVRMCALTAAIRAGPDAREAPAPAAANADVVALAAHRAPPKVTLLVPLHAEPESALVLLDALDRLDWPRERLEVKILLEAHDHATHAALVALEPPPWIEILRLPPGGPGTKPRALNFGLEMSDGDIIGIYDAEDRPEADQIRRITAAFDAAPRDVAAIQARLAHYNAPENWMARCFSIEYATWFDVMLWGFRDLRFPLPLGGTSVFFRRAALEEAGGWDAHNVTEDADLGMVLARRGLRTEVSASTTWEECVCHPGPWVRQRSRWLKGYLKTWAVHMRDPAALWRDLGPRGFLGFQALFLGAAVAYLGLPVFWATTAIWAIFGAPAWLSGLPDWAAIAALASLMLGQTAQLAAALIAVWRRREAWLIPWAFTLLAYWPLGAAAAWLAVIELAVAPFKWRKTTHGVGPFAAALRARAARRRERRLHAERARSTTAPRLREP